MIKKKGIVKKIYLLNKNSINNDKEIYHIEIKVEDSIKYESGDAIGIYPVNFIKDVNFILKFFNINRNNNEKKYFYLLKNKKNIYNLSLNFIKKYFLLLKKNEKKEIYEKNWSINSLLEKYPLNSNNLQSFYSLIEIMEPIKPRLYSISSYQKTHNEIIHITVLKKFYYDKNERIYYGHCSNFLSNLKIGDFFYFFIYNNKKFKLPKREKNIILISNGTGIAPFRSFLFEREFTNSSGKNWIFFGERYYSSDFLYKKEIENWIKKKIISRIDLAFSRDGKKKVYVQDKIWDNRVDFFSWIENGAYIYICGNKSMGIDVENIILRIIKDVGKKDPLEYKNILINEKRFLKDVY